MGRNVLIVLCLMFLSVTGYAQHLNSIGKIEVETIPTLKPYRIDYDAQKIYYDSLVLKGNTWYKVNNGFLTSLEMANNEKDKIFCYNNQGELKATILSDRVINLKVSKNENKIAWYDSEKIFKVNLNTFAVDTLTGSFVYSFIDNNKFIYYNPAQKVICFNGDTIASEKFPIQFLEFNNKLLVCSEISIYELKHQQLIPLYTFNGIFFDLKIMNDELFFVEKREKRKEIEFRLFKTNDFNQVQLVDMKTVEDD